MFIEPTITWVPSGFSGYIWLDTKIVLKKKKKKKKLVGPNTAVFDIKKNIIPLHNYNLFAITTQQNQYLIIIITNLINVTQINIDFEGR